MTAPINWIWEGICRINFLSVVADLSSQDKIVISSNGQKDKYFFILL